MTCERTVSTADDRPIHQSRLKGTEQWMVRSMKPTCTINHNRWPWVTSNLPAVDVRTCHWPSDCTLAINGQNTVVHCSVNKQKPNKVSSWWTIRETKPTRIDPGSDTVNRISVLGTSAQGIASDDGGRSELMYSSSRDYSVYYFTVTLRSRWRHVTTIGLQYRQRAAGWDARGY